MGWLIDLADGQVWAPPVSITAQEMARKGGRMPCL